MTIWKSAYVLAGSGAFMLVVAGCSGEGADTGSGATGARDEPASTASAGPASSTSEDEPRELSTESLAMAETAWLSVSEDGLVFTTYLDPDGRYRDVQGGEVLFAGAWEQDDGALCFTPDAGLRQCWAHGLPRRNGVMRVTSAAGREVEVRKVAYQPPGTEPSESQDGKDGDGKDGDGNGAETSPPDNEG